MLFWQQLKFHVPRRLFSTNKFSVRHTEAHYTNAADLVHKTNVADLIHYSSAADLIHYGIAADVVHHGNAEMDALQQ